MCIEKRSCFSLLNASSFVTVNSTTQRVDYPSKSKELDYCGDCLTLTEYFKSRTYLVLANGGIGGRLLHIID